MFYKETAFQETEIGRIPKDWAVKYVSELFQVETGTTPSTTKKVDYWEKGTVNWLTPADMSKSDGAIYISSGERRITEKAVKDCNLTVMPKGSLVLSTRAPVGYVAVLSEESAFNQGCKGLMPREYEDVCPEFYYYYLMSKNQILNNLSSGSTFKELSKGMLEKVRVVFFKPREQKAIVEVLSCVDLAIQKTDEVIAKTERLKKGLMQQLLTEGIGHKEFRDTEIGKIPRDWETFVLSSLLEKDIITYHLDGNHGEMYPHEEEFVNEGVPFLSANMISYGKIDFSKTKYVSEERAKQFRKGIAKDGDVLLAHNATVGPVAMLETSLPYVILGTTLTSFRCNPLYLDKYYLRYFMEGPLFQRQLQRIMKQTTRNQVPITAQRKLHFTVPAMDEQRKIAQPLCAIDEKLELERWEKSRLERIKQGLMDLLLTGKVRVKVD